MTLEERAALVERLEKNPPTWIGAMRIIWWPVNDCQEAAQAIKELSAACAFKDNNLKSLQKAFGEKHQKLVAAEKERDAAKQQATENGKEICRMRTRAEAAERGRDEWRCLAEGN